MCGGGGLAWLTVSVWDTSCEGKRRYLSYENKRNDSEQNV